MQIRRIVESAHVQAKELLTTYKPLAREALRDPDQARDDRARAVRGAARRRDRGRGLWRRGTAPARGAAAAGARGALAGARGPAAAAPPGSRRRNRRVAPALQLLQRAGLVGSQSIGAFSTRAALAGGRLGACFCAQRAGVCREGHGAGNATTPSRRAGPVVQTMHSLGSTAGLGHSRWIVVSCRFWAGAIDRFLTPGPRVDSRRARPAGHRLSAPRQEPRHIVRRSRLSRQRRGQTRRLARL